MVQRGENQREFVGDFGRGDLTGIFETANCPRTTVFAVRDSEGTYFAFPVQLLFEDGAIFWITVTIFNQTSPVLER